MRYTNQNNFQALYLSLSVLTLNVMKEGNLKAICAFASHSSVPSVRVQRKCEVIKAGLPTRQKHVLEGKNKRVRHIKLLNHIFWRVQNCL
jgi:hypothetical protein